MRTWITPSRWPAALLAVALAGLAGGLGARLAGADALGARVLALTVVAGLLPLAVSVARDLRRREPGVDLVALLAMGGALALGEELAGAVIAVMLALGRLLEAYAGDRARRELSALLERAPRVVHRYEDGVLASPTCAGCSTACTPSCACTSPGRGGPPVAARRPGPGARPGAPRHRLSGGRPPAAAPGALADRPGTGGPPVPGSAAHRALRWPQAERELVRGERGERQVDLPPPCGQRGRRRAAGRCRRAHAERAGRVRRRHDR